MLALFLPQLVLILFRIAEYVIEAFSSKAILNMESHLTACCGDVPMLIIDHSAANPFPCLLESRQFSNPQASSSLSCLVQ